MKLLRTPDKRFEKLTDYPFTPNYCEVDGIRIHYIDEGSTGGDETVLMLHGEPSWSYLYRKMIPIVAHAGFRVIAPDLVGFGKSEKPTEMTDYSYENHVNWVAGFLQALDLKNITLVAQDWGGNIGLRVAAENEARFVRICISNTTLPVGKGSPTEAFLKWREFSQKSPDFDIGNIINNATLRSLTPGELEAYNAPFPNDSYKAGARIFPSLVPTSPEDPAVLGNKKAWNVFSAWHKPFLTAFSDSDPITRGWDAIFQKKIPGAQGLEHVTLENAGHFVQEDQGEKWAEIIVKFIQDTAQS